jgi:hypothetical protein
MTEDERHASARGAAGAREARAQLLACARDAGRDPASLLASVAAVRASSARAAQPENPLSAASHHVQNTLGRVYGLREREDATGRPREGFAAPATLP